MSEKKNINLKKKEILGHINDLKVNFNALAIINRRLAVEKRQGFIRYDFHEKDIKDKKKEILDIINKEGGMLTGKVVKPVKEEADYPVYSEIIERNGINNLLVKPVSNNSTGILKINSEGNQAELCFFNGDIVYVQFNNIKAERGFFELLSLTKGKADFYQKESMDRIRNINKQTSSLIRRTLLKI